MTSKRMSRGHGADMGGEAKMSRNRTAEEGMIAHEIKEASKAHRAQQLNHQGVWDSSKGMRVYGPRAR